jgi:hypothetical protein
MIQIPSAESWATRGTVAPAARRPIRRRDPRDAGGDLQPPDAEDIPDDTARLRRAVPGAAASSEPGRPRERPLSAAPPLAEEACDDFPHARSLLAFNKTRDLVNIDPEKIRANMERWGITPEQRASAVDWIWCATLSEQLVTPCFFNAVYIFDAYLTHGGRAKEPCLAPERPSRCGQLRWSPRLLAVAALIAGVRMQETAVGKEDNLVSPSVSAIRHLSQRDADRIQAEILVTLGYDVRDADAVNTLKVLAHPFGLERDEYLLARALLQTSCRFLSLLGEGTCLLAGAALLLALRAARGAEAAESAVAPVAADLGECPEELRGAAAALYTCAATGAELAAGAPGGENIAPAPLPLSPPVAKALAACELAGFNHFCLCPLERAFPLPPRPLPRTKTRPIARLADCPRFLDDRRLGEGTYGVVRRVETELGTFAIKWYLESPPLGECRSREKLKLGPVSYDAVRELSSMAMLDSPHLLKISCFLWMPDGVVFPATPCYPATLLDEIKRGGIAPALVREYMRQLLSALAELGKCGIIHRDVKPENVFLDTSGTVVLGDFGSCRRFDYPARPFTPNMGTLWYRPPEILMGMAWYPTSDVWSVGCIAYELLTLQALFLASTEAGTLACILNTLGKPSEEEWPHFDLHCPPLRLRKTRRVSCPHEVISPELRRPLGDDADLRKIFALLDRSLVLNPAKRASAAELADFLGSDSG